MGRVSPGAVGGLSVSDVDINDISKGTQTNDVKVTLDGENVTLSVLPDTASGDLAAIKAAIEGTLDTELPSASALSDAFSNPTTPPIGAFLMGWDGSNWNRILNAQANTDNVSESDKGIPSNARLYGYDGSAWDRLRGTSADGLLVNLGSNNDVTVTNDTADNLKADANIQVGDSDVSTSNPIPTSPNANASVIGTTTYYNADLDETKVEVTDNPNVRIYSIVAFNTTAAPLFLQLFDADSDDVTIGATTPTNQYVVPGNADSDGAGFIVPLPVPKSYSTGFTIACTTDSEGSSSPGAGACIVNIEYISAA